MYANENFGIKQLFQAFHRSPKHERLAVDVNAHVITGSVNPVDGLHVHAIGLTTVADRFTGDVHFPDLDLEEWREIQHDEHDPDDSNAFRHTIVVLERERPA